MIPTDCRSAPRFTLHVPLSFCSLMPHRSRVEQRASSINISAEGVCFLTRVAMCVGDAINILLAMPKRVTGTKSNRRRFVGRVAHIESTDMPQGCSRIGIHLIRYEPVLQTDKDETVGSKLHRRRGQGPLPEPQQRLCVA